MAPFVVSTVSVAVAKTTDEILAVSWMLLGVLLACTPVMMRELVEVIFNVFLPLLAKRACPVPLLVTSESNMVVVLVVGATVAVIVPVPPRGTTGVPEKLTVGATVPGPMPTNGVFGQGLPFPAQSALTSVNEIKASAPKLPGLTPR